MRNACAWLVVILLLFSIKIGVILAATAVIAGPIIGGYYLFLRRVPCVQDQPRGQSHESFGVHSRDVDDADDVGRDKSCGAQ